MHALSTCNENVRVRKSIASVALTPHTNTHAVHNKVQQLLPSKTKWKQEGSTHEIELVVKTREDLCNGGGVGDHAHGTLHLGKITTWHHGGWLVVDTALEASWAPVNKLDGTLGLDGCNSSVHVLGYNVTTVHEAACHVLAVAGVALGHHGCRLKGRVGNLCHRELLVVRLLSRDDRCVG